MLLCENVYMWSDKLIAIYKYDTYFFLLMTIGDNAPIPFLLIKICFIAEVTQTQLQRLNERTVNQK